MNMPPEKGTVSFLGPRKSNAPPWHQRVFFGAVVLIVGYWAASQYANGLTTTGVFDYVKSTVRGQAFEHYGSTLTEPWSQVSYLVFVQVNGNETQYS